MWPGASVFSICKMARGPLNQRVRILRASGRAGIKSQALRSEHFQSWASVLEGSQYDTTEIYFRGCTAEPVDRDRSGKWPFLELHKADLSVCLCLRGWPTCSLFRFGPPQCLSAHFQDPCSSPLVPASPTRPSQQEHTFVFLSSSL